MTNKQLQALKNLRDQINSELCDSFYETSQEGREALDVAIKILEQEPKKGHWIDYQEDRWIYAQCSECGEVHDSPSDYCPSCGAKMVDLQESEAQDADSN